MLMREAWALRLKLSGFSDIEDPSNPDGPLARERWWDRGHGARRGHGAPVEGWESSAQPTRLEIMAHRATEGAAYYRALGISAQAIGPHGVPGASYYRADRRKDRLIARALAKGEPWSSITKRVRVGRSRIRYVRDLMLKHAERLDERDGD